jgi:hypothetical protein
MFQPLQRLAKGEKPLKTAVFSRHSNTGLKPGANKIPALKTIGILKTRPKWRTFNFTKH